MTMVVDSSRTSVQRAQSYAGLSTSLNRTVILLYSLPVFALVAYSALVLPLSVSWSTLILGILIASFGSVAMILSLRKWELSLLRQRVNHQPVSLKPQVDEPEWSAVPVHAAVPVQQQASVDVSELQDALSHKQQEVSDAVAQLEAQQHDLARLSEENGHLRAQLQELEESQSGNSDDLERKDALIQEYQQTITEQRAIIEKKQHYISKLELKVQDLTYEVKTLLQLGDLEGDQGSGSGEASANHPAIDVFKGDETTQQDMETMYEQLPQSSSEQVLSPYDAAVQLRRYVDVAQKLTGARHLAGGESRFSDLAVDSYAIDLRRLYESFRNESGATILLYSNKENRILFVNDHVKAALGWSPEKFVKDFSSLVQQGQAEWRHALQQTETQESTQVRIILKDKAGEDRIFQCYLGRIQSGVFADHVIGVFYEA